MTVGNYDGMWPPPALVPEAYTYDSDGQIVGPRHEHPEPEPAGAPVPTVLRRFDAVHIITATRSQVFNIHRLCRAVRLLQDGHPTFYVAEILGQAYPAMTGDEVHDCVMAAEKVNRHNIDLDRLDS